MTQNNIDKRISYKKGSNGPKHEKLNGNVISIFPIPHEKPWYEDIPQEDNGDKRVERSIPPEPYGEDTFGFPEYRDYLDKLRPGAIPLSFPKFMDQLDMLPSDQWGRRPRKKEGVMAVVADPAAWHKKFLRNFGYTREFLDNLKRDDLERLFDDIMIRSARRGRA